MKLVIDEGMFLKDRQEETPVILTKKMEKTFTNGKVFLLHTNDGYPVEVTDTFLPYYTKNAIGAHQNALTTTDVGSKAERWMIGVSTMSGCPVRCKFCATSCLKKYRNLTADEIIEQVVFVLGQSKEDPRDSKEFKINYTRMGEPFLNLDAVKQAIETIDGLSSNNIHHYVSTIGLKNADYSWIQGNITLQISLHSLDENKRNWLIPYKNKATIEELGQIRTGSNLKTTINMTLVDESDFDIELLKKYFDPKYFFIKLSPINKNVVSEMNDLGEGCITGRNLK